MRHLLPLLPLLLLLLVACGDAAEGTGGRPGNSGSSSTPECGAFSQVCIAEGLDTPIALGADYTVSISSQVAGSSGAPLALETVDPTVVTALGPTLHAAGEGFSGVLFVGESEVLDFIHVWVAAADELRVWRYSENGDRLGQVVGDSQLLVGDEILISVEPYAGSQPLYGQFVLTRDVSSASVAIVPDPVPGWYRVLARAAGTATLTFSGLGVSKTWNIEVLP